jgi:hypothetical protein
MHKNLSIIKDKIALVLNKIVDVKGKKGSKKFLFYVLSHRTFRKA